MEIHPNTTPFHSVFPSLANTKYSTIVQSVVYFSIHMGSQKILFCLKLIVQEFEYLNGVKSTNFCLTKN